MALLLLSSLLAPAGTFAQEQPPEDRPPPYWKAVLKDGEFLIPHPAIASMSMSNYVVDGTLRVYEVSIDTVGSVQARFYFIEEITVQSPVGVGQSAIEDLKSRAREIQNRAGVADATEQVSKTYPQTTHAHTVEFRLPNQQAVERLYRSLEDSWLKRRSVTFRLES